MTNKASYTIGPIEPALLDKTMGALLEDAAKAVPDRVAIIFGRRDASQRPRWTYGEMYADAKRVAQALAARFGHGERVAICAPNSPEWVLLQFGAAMAGVVLVTVNPAYTAEELAYVLKQSKSAGILVVPDYRANQMLASVEQVRTNCPALREVIRMDKWDAFLATADEGTKLPDVQPGDACMIQYTSGTTGFPKGALLHHRGVVNNGYQVLDRMQMGEGDVFLTMMPLFHCGGCILCVLGSVSHQVTQVIVEAFEPGLVLELIESCKVNAFNCVPTMMIGMMEHPDFSLRDTSSIRRVISGGATVPAEMVRKVEQAWSAKFTIVFGQTECSPVACMTWPDDAAEDKATTLGGAMPHVENKIVDVETGDTVPHDQLGEFCTRGYHVMHEYFEMPEATHKTVDEDGWLHTGDLCSMDPRGYCTIQGRLKDVIIRGGENIYPRELEELLFQHPMVGQAAVVGLPDDRLGEVVGAFIRAAPGQTPSRGVLFAYLRTRASPQKTPKHWYLVDDFPLTGSGKIQKFVLRQQWASGEFQDELA